MTDAAILSSALYRARERKLPVGELLSAVGSLAGEPTYIAELYRTWLEHNGDDPLIFAMYFNYAAVVSGLNDLPAARHALEEAIRINPDFYPPYINLGHVFERMGEIGLAAQQWYACAGRLGAVNGDNVNYRTSALKQVGRILERVNWDAHAEDALRQSLEINPNQSDVVQHWVSLRQRQCKWPVMAPWSTITRKHLLQGISSLSLCAYTDDPLFQLASAYVYASEDVGRPPVDYLDRHAALRADPPRRRRIGYLSSDFREHAVGYLTSEMFDLHDREKVEVFLYYCGIEASGDPLQERIKGSAEHWCDISPMSDQAAAEQILSDKIEILVDLNGYTNGARSKMLAMCPAPIIVNWLGYPGSLGSPYHHYIIADDFIIPPGDELYYSEKVLRIPCYQPNNSKRAVAAHRPTREEAGLPADAVVYCCFNGTHKITPFTWARWMDILKAVPNSVLWLLDSIATTNARLKELAAAHGVEPERILFAPKLRNERHLARYPLADIFLDTVPYGAHTTSSDALWMGVPVVTLAGRSFPARVCGSLIRSAGLGDLICDDPEQFINLAVALGRDPARRTHYREKLAASRDTCVLFDTQLLVSSLERLYEEMWADFMNDRLLRPDLSNLDLYNEIGVALDRDDVELTSVSDYRALYRARLANHNRYNYLRPDARDSGKADAQPLERLALMTAGEYAFTNDWFTQNIPIWDYMLAPLKPQRVLEIGAFEGRATCYLIDKFNDCDGGFEIHCVDTWQGGVEHQNEEMTAVEARFDANIEVALAKVSKPVRVIKHKKISSQALAELISAGHRDHFDMIYIDGSHQAPDVLADTVLAFQLLRVGGFMVFDDYLWAMEQPGSQDPFNMPKPAIDAFLNIFQRKMIVLRGVPIYQLFAIKFAL